MACQARLGPQSLVEHLDDPLSPWVRMMPRSSELAKLDKLAYELQQDGFTRAARPSHAVSLAPPCLTRRAMPSAVQPVILMRVKL